MDRIRHLSTVITEKSNNVQDGYQMAQLSLYNWGGDLSRFRSRSLDHPSLNFTQRYWSRLRALYRQWELVPAAPLDLLAQRLHAITTSVPEPPKATPIDSAPSLAWDLNQPPPNIGQIALHPRLPLLAVCCSKDCEIQLYNVQTSMLLFGIQCRLREGPEDTENTEDTEDIEDIDDTGTIKRRVTCLSFSNENHLAVGLGDGSVLVIELDLRLNTESRRDDQNEKHRRFRIETVRLLPDCDLQDNMDLLGPVTNVVFSSGCGLENGVWLAIATQRSGVWIWNHKMKEVVRAICTPGLNQGCLQWLQLSAEPRKFPQPHQTPQAPQPTQLAQSPPSPPRGKNLSESTVQKWAGMLGDAEDISKLDEYFSPSVGFSTSRDYPQISTPAPRHVSSMSSNSSIFRETGRSPDIKYYSGQSLLVVGTKSGKVCVQKLWHSFTTMRLETSVEFYPHKYTQIADQISSGGGSTNIEIAHLAVRPHYAGTGEVTLPILLALGRDSSILHEFAVCLPFVQPAGISRLRQVRRFASTAFQNLVKLPFTLTQTDHRWLPLSPSQEADHDLPITYETSHPIYDDLSKPTAKAFLTSISMPLTTNEDLLLATMRPDPSQAFGRPKHSHCVLFSHDPQAPCSPHTPIYTIKPLALTPLNYFRRGVNSRPQFPLGYYSCMLEPLEPRRSRTGPRTNVPYANSPDIFYDHDIVCGQVAWGKSSGGRLMGAYLYHPATMLDDCVGVAMFEVVN